MLEGTPTLYEISCDRDTFCYTKESRLIGKRRGKPISLLFRPAGEAREVSML
jgi:hypothetical protein